MIKRKLHDAWRYEFYLLVLKISHSFAALTREIFSTLEDKIRISARPCNILYISSDKGSAVPDTDQSAVI